MNPFRYWQFYLMPILIVSMMIAQLVFPAVSVSSVLVMTVFHFTIWWNGYLLHRQISRDRDKKQGNQHE